MLNNVIVVRFRLYCFFLFFAIAVLIFGCIYFLEGCALKALDQTIKINEATIKFVPPEGWRKSISDSYTISYTIVNGINSATFNISYLRIPLAAGPQGDDIIAIHMLEAKQDKNVLRSGWTTCAGLKALKVISLQNDKKKEGIWFSKDGDLFTVWFTSDEKHFDSLLPIVEKSIKSIRIISIEPKNKEYGASIFSGQKRQ